MISFSGTSSYGNEKAESWQNLGSIPFHCTMIVVDPTNAIKNPLFKTAFCLVDLMSNGWNRTHVNEKPPGKMTRCLVQCFTNQNYRFKLFGNCCAPNLLNDFGYFQRFQKPEVLQYQFQLPPLLFLFSMTELLDNFDFYAAIPSLCQGRVMQGAQLPSTSEGLSWELPYQKDVISLVRIASWVG